MQDNENDKIKEQASLFSVIPGCVIKLDLTVLSAVILNLSIEPVKTTAANANT